MKKYLLLMLPLCLLLTGCAPSRREAVQAYYKSIRTAQMEAQVVVHLSSDDRTFSVTAAYDREKGATTTIVEPELLQGLSATVSQEDMHCCMTAACGRPAPAETCRRPTACPCCCTRQGRGS